ncbi:MAG: hypothetical protein KGN78_05015 [Actinomycetales bacterium]|nr:hypothetical protein [Actinomycetales bacterium]
MFLSNDCLPCFKALCEELNGRIDQADAERGQLTTEVQRLTQELETANGSRLSVERAAYKRGAHDMRHEIAREIQRLLDINKIICASDVRVVPLPEDKP